MNPNCGGLAKKNSAWFLVSILVLLLLPPSAPADTQSPDDPNQVPVSVVGPHGTGRAHFVHDDGVTHFVWSSRCHAPVPGCTDIQYRTYDSTSQAWSVTTVLRDADQNTTLPRIYWAGGALQVLWLEGGDFYAGEPVLLWWCRLDGTACGESQTISQPDRQAFEPDAAVGPDGRLRVVWQAEDHETSDARVFMRQQRSDGWGPLVAFESGGVLQRAPAVVVDEAGRAHVAWRENPPDEPVANFQFRFVIATVESGTAVPSSIKELSHAPNFRREVSLAIHDGILHALYSTETDVYHRQRSLDGSEWSPPVNVSRWERRVAGTSPIVLADEHGLTALWLRVPHGNVAWMVSEREGGVWTRPHSIIDPPYTQMGLFPHAERSAGGALHLLWSASLEGEDVGEVGLRPHYRVLSGESMPYAPPEIGDVVPASGAWMRADPTSVRASIRSDAAIDLDSSKLTVDGVDVPFQLSAEGVLTASVPGLAEGRREVVLEIRDSAGGLTSRAWDFHIDRTKPFLEWSVVDGSGAGVAGWQTMPVSVRGQATDAGPVRVQWDVNKAGAWLDLKDGSMTLPEGYLVDLRLRAIDAAGNVDLAPVVRVGWDGTPPEVRLGEVADLSSNGTVVFSFFTVDGARNDHDDSDGHNHHDHSDGHDHHDHDASLPGASTRPGPGSPVSVQALLRVGNTTAHAASVASQEGRIVVAGVPSGVYQVDVTAVDEAGNQAVVAQDIRVVVDVDRPRAELVVMPDGRLLRIHDEVSGIQTLRVTGQGYAREESLAGTKTYEVMLPLLGELEASVVDVAGHRMQWILSPDEVRPVPVAESPLVESMEGEVGGRSDKQSPAVGAWLVLVACVLRRRRT